LDQLTHNLTFVDVERRYQESVKQCILAGEKKYPDEETIKKLLKSNKYGEYVARFLLDQIQRDKASLPKGDIIVPMVRQPTHIASFDFSSLKDGEQVRELVINLFLGSLENDQIKKEKKKISHYFEVSFISDLICKDYNYNSFNFKDVERYIPEDLFQMEHLFFPIYTPPGHWTMAHVDLVNKKYEYLDSMHGHKWEILAAIRLFLAFAMSKFGKSIPLDTEIDFPAVPIQTNAVDCGVFLCNFALNLGFNKILSKDLKPFDVSTFRKQIQETCVKLNT